MSALRTYAQLLLRRLESSSEHRPLVEGMLAEQNQLNRYVNALDSIGQPALSGRQPEPAPLMLPPDSSAVGTSLQQQLMPLIERAKAILCNLEDTELSPDGGSRYVSRQSAERETLRNIEPSPQLDLFAGQ